jgi:FtsZ-binding cell division protein ZapB
VLIDTTSDLRVQIDELIGRNNELRQQIGALQEESSRGEQEVKKLRSEYDKLLGKQKESRMACRIIDSAAIERVANLLGWSIGASAVGIAGGALTLTGNLIQKKQEKFNEEYKVRTDCTRQNLDEKGRAACNVLQSSPQTPIQETQEREP